MSPILTTFLFEAVNFLLLAAVLAWVFFKPMRAALDRRRDALQQQTQAAADATREAQRLQAQWEQQWSNLEGELEQRRQERRAVAEREAAGIVKSARSAAQREMDHAQARLSHLEQVQRQHLARIIAQTAGAAVDRLLRQIEQPGLDHALMEAACRQLQSFEDGSLTPVRIESARPLDDQDRANLIKSLGAAGASAEFRVLEHLGVGLRVATSHGLIDVSSAGLSTFAEHILAEKLGLAAEGSVDAELPDA